MPRGGTLDIQHNHSNHNCQRMETLGQLNYREKYRWCPRHRFSALIYQCSTCNDKKRICLSCFGVDHYDHDIDLANESCYFEEPPVTDNTLGNSAGPLWNQKSSTAVEKKDTIDTDPMAQEIIDTLADSTVSSSDNIQKQMEEAVDNSSSA